MATCSVRKTSRPPEISWLRDGREISSDERISLVKVSQNSITLSIKNVLPEDVGNYTCVVNTAEGSESVTVALVVAGDRCILYLAL